MANRRILPPRGARPSSAPQQTAAGRSRSRSVVGATQRSRLTTPVEGPPEPTPPPPAKPEKPANTRNEGESNIQVVLRCRRRSDREIQENSPIIVQIPGARSTELLIQTAAPSSSLGLVAMAAPRKYPFDVVFGPEADQAMIYQDVVSPMLDEILKGYNCTLFAYGQTGTGKTYTMQGDLEPTPMGNPSAHAGMIPRVLNKLFHMLETTVPDYSVKISFVELYNEELRDLLAPELAAPSGSTQPMGMGGASRDKSDNQGGLKIFDDANKKGVFIQGLEERPVRDAADALGLLKKGSDRRQIAATKFNDHSSRSHSVFAITVITKEKSNIGDDLLKVGKLNLVDLAGSENIGRSGAENQRAREAGMINQSLLTLGRVINALVDKSSHVPYRESKLTRLLQDSLGGRTKTCIIATISPARSNMEETLSTLDYALRAKSIRNRPEINQRMSRNALIKEYVAEIERLQADLYAAYEKNGVFFSQENWKRMAAEQELKDTALQEALKNKEIADSQLRHLKEEFDQSLSLLEKSNGELKETREKLHEKDSQLSATQGKLRLTTMALEEEVVVRSAYQENEPVLDGVANGLRDAAHQSVNDLGRLFGKLERKTTVFTENVKAVSTHTRKITSEAREFSSKLDDFVKVANQHILNIRTESEQYKTKELETLSGFSTRITAQLDKLQEDLKVVRAKEEASDEALTAMKATVDETQEGVKSVFGRWSEDLRQHCETTCKEAETSTASSCSMVEKAFKALGSITEAILSEAQDYIATERKSLQEAKALADTTSNAEIARLQQQNALLTRLLESERIKAESAKEDLLNRIGALLGSFTAERDQSLREAFSEMTESNASAEAGMVKLGKDQGQRLDAVVEKGVEWSSALGRREGELKRTRDGGFKNIANASTTMRENVSKVQGVVSSALPVFSADLHKRMQSHSAAFGESYDDMSRAKRARIDATDSMAADVQASYRFMQRGVASSSRNLETTTGQALSETSGLSRAVQNHHASSTAHLSEIYQTSQLLLDQGAREDMPTGTTPRKRTFEYTDQWTLTKTREVLLKEYSQAGGSSSSSSSSQSETASIFEHATVHDDEESEPESTVPSTSEAEIAAEVAVETEEMDEGEDQDETVRMKSPPVPIMAPPPPPKTHASGPASTSSTSSSLMPPPPVPTLPHPQHPPVKRHAPPAKTGLPSRGTLQDRTSNMPTHKASTRSLRMRR